MGYNEDISVQQLRQWQNRVNAFGGRKQEKKQLVQELADSQLGNRFTYLTTQAVFPMPTVTLAEMKLKAPIEVDVIFSFENVFPPGLQSAALPAPASNPLDPGNGFLRISWGSPNGNQHVAEVDANHGWRFPFVASNLKVEYVPEDLFANGATSRMPGNQPRNVVVKALIAPRSSAPCKPLTRTAYYPFAFGNNTLSRPVPRYAYTARPCIDGNNATLYFVGRVTFTDGLGVVLSNYMSSGSANTWPGFPMLISPLPVPQRAGFLEITSTSANSPINNPTVIYELSL